MLLHTLLVVCLSFVVSCVGQSRTAFSVSSVRGERGRWQHCSAYCPTMDVLVIVGGLDSSFQNSETSDSVLVHSFSDDSWHSFDDLKEYPKDVRTCEVGVVSDDGKTCALGLMFGSVTRPTMEVIGLTVGKVTSKDSSTFTVNTEAVASTSLVAQLPASRILFCSTFVNGVFYMYGGFSVKDGQFSVQYRSPWKLSLSTSDSRITGAEWDEVKVLSDTVDALDSTPPPLYSCSLTAAMHDDSVNLFLYGGESANSGDYSYYESLWQLDTNSSMWEQTNPTIPLRRLHHNTVYYQGSLFVLGGLVPMSGELRPRSHFFSTTILQSNVFSENRQASCLPEGKPSKREDDASLVHDHSIGIWCQYDGNSVGNYPTRGYAGSSCTLRRNELVCSFGASDRSGDSISNQIVTIDLNRISEHLEVAEQDVAGTSIFSTFYFFFGLLGVTTALVCMLGARDRHRSNGRRLNQPPEPRARNRGASATLVATIPEITFSASDGNNPESEQSEQNLCPICISDYEEGDKLRVLPCTHRFHTACIDRWLEKDKACPMCKQDIDCDLESAPRAHGGEASEQMNQRVAEPSFLARRPMNPWQQNPLQSQESNNESSNGSRPTAVEMTVV